MPSSSCLPKRDKDDSPRLLLSVAAHDFLPGVWSSPETVSLTGTSALSVPENKKSRVMTKQKTPIYRENPSLTLSSKNDDVQVLC